MTQGDDTPLPRLPRRPDDAHKGVFGTVLVVGGSAAPGGLRMIGAPALAARGAIRAGVGLARIMAPAPVLDAALATLPEATGVPIECDDAGRIRPHAAAQTLDAQLGQTSCLIVGPGMGSGDEVESLVLRCVGQAEAPVVLDADGLNALANVGEAPRAIRASCVLTPHPGEYRRLADSLSIRLDPTDESQRVEAAAELARRLGVVVVLKGRHSVVSDGARAWTCTRGRPVLSTGGTGDVLSGVIGALIAQFVAKGPAAIGSVTMPRPKGKPLDLYDAARVGVEAHAIAGEVWTDREHASAGMLARELGDEIPGVIETMREG
ncbi:MAG: NAD(P)H-hydrate dehydratase [Phycisphaerales bacterium]